VAERWRGSGLFANAPRLSQTVDTGLPHYETNSSNFETADLTKKLDCARKLVFCSRCGGNHDENSGRDSDRRINIHAPETDATELRKRVGMVFQKSNAFPMSIYENIAYGLRIAGVRDRRIMDETVENSRVIASSRD
jgi:energy-coupling factor transporter ATP-binding protein EcfA2